METPELLNKKVGTIEAKKLEAKTVKIASIRIQTKKADGVALKSPLAHFECKHPDKEELISISKVKIENDGKLRALGLWVSLDADENIQKGSSLASLLEFKGWSSPEEAFGKDIETVKESETSDFLCLKAY